VSSGPTVEPNQAVESTRFDERPTATRASHGMLDNAIVQITLQRAFALTLVAAVGILCVPPVYYVIDSALGNGASGLTQMLHDPAFGRTLEVTIYVALGSVLISVVVGTLLAWGAQGLSGRSQWLSNIPLIPLLMPFLAMVLGYIFLLDTSIGYGNWVLRKLMFWSHSGRGPFNVYTVPFIMIVTATSLISFVYMFVRSALAQLDEGVYDAAVASGASPVRAFLTVVLPMLRPALVYSSLIGMLLALGQFTAPLFLGVQQNISVLATSIYASQQLSPPNIPLAAAYGLPITVAGLLFIALQRIVLRNQEQYVSTGTKGTGRLIAKTGWLSRVALIGYGLLVVAGPIVSVAIVAFQPYWSQNVDLGKFTLANFRAIFDDPSLATAIKNSVSYAVAATAIVLPLGFGCAKLLYRRKLPVLTGILDVLVSIPLGVPAVIFGIGFLIAYTIGPLDLYGDPIGLVLVYVVISLPFVTRMILVALLSLGNNLVDAGAVSGAPMWRRSLSLELPMLRPALGNAAAICLIFAMHEFSASVLVSSPTTQVMGVALYNQYAIGSTSVPAALALVMCALTAVCVLLALAVGHAPRPRSAPRRGMFLRRG